MRRTGYLYDVVNGGPPDASIRPNQIFAVSLPHSMLSSERAKQVVSIVQQHLLTPYGLRSLAPSDPQYRGRYTGDGGSRDGAYHQGTVWPWLMGPFITAYIKVNGRKRAGTPPSRSMVGAFERPSNRRWPWPHFGDFRRRCARIDRLAALRRRGAWQRYCGPR